MLPSGGAAPALQSRLRSRPPAARAPGPPGQVLRRPARPRAPRARAPARPRPPPRPRLPRRAAVRAACASALSISPAHPDTALRSHAHRLRQGARRRGQAGAAVQDSTERRAPLQGCDAACGARSGTPATSPLALTRAFEMRWPSGTRMAFTMPPAASASTNTLRRLARFGLLRRVVPRASASGRALFRMQAAHPGARRTGRPRDACILSSEQPGFQL